MYTPQDRDRLLQVLKEQAEKLQGVLGMLLVGSGAAGFRDEYSDIDVLIVASEPEQVTYITEQMNHYIKDEHRVLRSKLYRHEEDIYVSCILLNNGLGIDMGVWSMKKLRATKPNWTILFDRSGALDSRLKESLSSHTERNLQAEIEDSMSGIWQFIMNAAVSIRRRQTIKAAKDMDMIRDQIIRVLTAAYGVNYDPLKAIDELQDEAVERLKKSYIIHSESAESAQKLHDIVACYFDIILRYQDDADHQKYKTQMLDYVREMLQEELRR
ncbi:nucleotidyltransferase domain-containing protein [Marinicrinis lubricantis]|uniref:Nucleotidyltransferase domain-containing protein n=1 Tax=Marinicrinis lubricantis TaxID=2086470 RepID=A0ABW1IRN4_9BACL